VDQGSIRHCGTMDQRRQDCVNIDAITYYCVLSQEIETLQTLIRPQATGHIRTTISVLEHRLITLKNQMTDLELTFLALSA